jgi:peptide deformylase
MNVIRLKIRLYGDACLRGKCEKVVQVESAERMLIEAMLETMRVEKGIGLAAPQVGVNRQLFVTNAGGGYMVFVNPKIIRRSGKAIMEEGCLSIPGVHIYVRRPEKIWVRFMDENNHIHERQYGDLMARVIQHETDHLHGKLIVDYASKHELMEFKDVLRDLEASAKNE